MILNSIVIENIRSYPHGEVEFPQGITLFEGDIGSGKSTILMAIEFALFGLGSQKPESLLAKKKDSGHVVLDFSTGETKCEIKRALKRKGGKINQDPKNSWIRVNGEHEQLSPSELKQKVLQILKFNEPADPRAESRIFRYAIFTPQEAMKDVLSDRQRRLETVRKAFGIEDYSVARENISEVLSGIKSDVRLFEERSSGIAELEAEISESEKAVSESEEAVLRTNAQIRELKEEEAQKTGEIKALQDKKDQQRELEATRKNIAYKIEQTKQQMVQAEKDIDRDRKDLEETAGAMDALTKTEKPKTAKSLPEITADIEELQNARDKRISMEAEKKTITGDLAKLEESLGERKSWTEQTAKDRIKELEEGKDLAQNQYDKIKDEQEEIKDRKAQKNAEKNALKKEIAGIAKLGKECPTCGREITKDHQRQITDEKNELIANLEKEIKEISDSFFESGSRLENAKSELEGWEEKISDIVGAVSAVKDYAEKLSRSKEIEKDLQEISSEHGENSIEQLTELKEKVLEYENVQEQIRRIKDEMRRIQERMGSGQESIRKMQAEVVKKESELAEADRELEEFEMPEDRVPQIERRLEQIRSKTITLSETMAANSERLKNERQQIKEKTQRLAESRRWEAKSRKFSQFSQWLEEFFIPAISQIEKNVLLSILQNFNETYTRLYSILVEDPTKESRIDEDFTPVVDQDGYEQDIRFLSGGEKTSVALAYRLTLNLLMRKETESMESNLLILDEPTDGFSKNQLGKIKELLEELKSGQVILVSHERELETHVDHVFRVFKDNGVSRVSRTD